MLCALLEEVKRNNEKRSKKKILAQACDWFLSAPASAVRINVNYNVIMVIGIIQRVYRGNTNPVMWRCRPIIRNVRCVTDFGWKTTIWFQVKREVAMLRYDETLSDENETNWKILQRTSHNILL